MSGSSTLHLNASRGDIIVENAVADTLGGAIFASASSQVIVSGGHGGSAAAGETAPALCVTFARSAAYAGGAIAATSGSAVAMSGCVRFVLNGPAERGAGLYAERATVAMEGGGGRSVLFANNTAQLEGGAVFQLLSSLQADGAVFNWNTANAGGAVSSSQGDVALSNVAFTGNSASGEGGAVDLQASDTFAAAAVYATENIASSGGFLSSRTPLRIVCLDCTLSSNVAFGGDGGAFSISGISSFVQLTNTTASGNRAFGGGGLMFVRSLSSVTPVTAAAALADPTSHSGVVAIVNGTTDAQDNLAADGGVLYCSNAFVSLQGGGSVQHNHASSSGGAVHLASGCSMQVGEAHSAAIPLSLQFNTAGSVGASLAAAIGASVVLHRGRVASNCVLPVGLGAASTDVTDGTVGISARGQQELCARVLAELSSPRAPTADPPSAGVLGSAVFCDVHRDSVCAVMASAEIEGNAGGGVGGTGEACGDDGIAACDHMSLGQQLVAKGKPAIAPSAGLQDNAMYVPGASDGSATGGLVAASAAANAVGMAQSLDGNSPMGGAAPEQVARVQLVSTGALPTVGVAMDASTAPVVRCVDRSGNAALSGVPQLGWSSLSLNIVPADTTAGVTLGGSTAITVHPTTGVASLSGLVIQSGSQVVQLRLDVLPATLGVSPLLLNVSLRGCPRGQGVSPAGNCEACGDGTVALESEFGACMACPPGTVAREDNTACLPCDIGTYSPAAGLSNCLQCPDGRASFLQYAGGDDVRFPVLGGVDCTQCPAVALCSGGRMTLRPDVFVGSIVDSSQTTNAPSPASGARLLQVPAGNASANTASGESQDVQLQRSQAIQIVLGASGSTLPCAWEGSCVTDSDSLTIQCADGYRGALCGGCDYTSGNGFTRQASACVECAAQGSLVATATGIALLAFGVTVYYSLMHTFGQSSPRGIVLRLLLNHMQLSGTLSLLQVRLSSAVSGVLSISSTVGGGWAQQASMACLFGSNFYSYLALLLCTPLIIAYLSLLVQCAFVACRKLKAQHAAAGTAVPPAPESRGASAPTTPVQNINPLASRSTPAGRRLSTRVAATGAPQSIAGPATTHQTSALGKLPPARGSTASSRGAALSKSLQNTATQYLRTFASSAAERQARLTSFAALPRESIPALLALWYLLYNSFARAALTVLPCTQTVDGTRYVLADLNTECDTAAHRTAVALSTTCIVVLCLGTPAALALALFKNRHALQSPRVFRALGFLYDGFKQERGLYAWQAVIMLRNFGVVAILTTVPSAQLQIMWSAMVVSVAAWAHLSMQPYASALYNHLEGLSLMSTVGCVVMSMSLVTGLSDDERPSEAFQSGVMWLLFVVQLGVLIGFAYFLAALGKAPGGKSGASSDGIAAWDKRGAAASPAQGVELSSRRGGSVSQKLKRLSISAMAQSSVLNAGLKSGKANATTAGGGVDVKQGPPLKGNPAATAQAARALSARAPAAGRADRVKSVGKAVVAES